MAQSCILLVFPLKKELAVFLSCLEEQGFKIKKEKIKNVQIFRSDQLVLAHGGHGKVQFAIQTQYILNELKVSSLILVGVAGALSKSVNVFDLVVGEKIIEHDYKVRFTETKPPIFSGDQNLLKKVKHLKFENFKVHRGIIASGDEDIVDAKRAQELFDQTLALAVAWEGAGGARVASYNKIPYLEVRAITDVCVNAPSDFEKNLSVALQNAWELISKLI